MSKFEILRGMGDNISGILPAEAQPIGRALMIDSIDADTGERTFVVAEGKCDGFMTRASRTTVGLTDSEQLYGLATDDTGGETPFTVGERGSIEVADALEVEGTDYIVISGTGAITSGTAVDTALSFSGGKFYVAQPDDYAQYLLKGVMTEETEGNLRISVERIKGDLTA